MNEANKKYFFKQELIQSDIQSQHQKIGHRKLFEKHVQGDALKPKTLMTIFR